jgi:hypothetical protein
MKLLNKSLDGGPESPVTAYFLFEIKSFGSVALLKFNPGTREAHHTHAFNAFTWFLLGDMVEETLDGCLNRYKRSLLPKFTSKNLAHRVIALKTSWCFTIRGPWVDTWTEYKNGKKITLTHGRKVVNDTSN